LTLLLLSSLPYAGTLNVTGHWPEQNIERIYGTTDDGTDWNRPYCTVLLTVGNTEASSLLFVYVVIVTQT
jgi:hypothetical protein